MVAMGGRPWAASLYLILIEEGTQTCPHCLAGKGQFLEAQVFLILEVSALGENIDAVSMWRGAIQDKKLKFPKYYC